MGDVLESLFRIIPVVIAIIWVMRRVSRKKSGQAKTTAKPLTKTPAKPAGKQAESTISERLHHLEEKAIKTARAAREGFLGEPAPPSSEKITKRRVSTAPIPEVVQGKRIVENLSRQETEKIYADTNTSNSLERVKELSPLAQGMIWSFILDEPPALKEPKM